MKDEQKAGIFFSAAGLISGFVSWALGSPLTGFVGAIAVFVAFIFISKNYIHGKKTDWIAKAGLGSWLFMWLAVWVLAYNAL